MPWPRWFSRVLIILVFVILIAIPTSLQLANYLTKAWIGYRHYDAEYKATLEGQQTKSPGGCKIILKSENLWSHTGTDLWYHRRACDGMNEALIKIKEDKKVSAPMRV